MCLRTIVTFLVMSGFGYTAREKLFYALAWTPKATVQAALSGTHYANVVVLWACVCAASRVNRLEQPLDPWCRYMHASFAVLPDTTQRAGCGLTVRCMAFAHAVAHSTGPAPATSAMVAAVDLPFSARPPAALLTCIGRHYLPVWQVPHCR